MLYSLLLSTASGNSGTEQFNIRSSVPVDEKEEVGKDIIPDIIEDKELIKEAEEVLDKIEDAVFDAKDTLFKLEFEKDSFNASEEVDKVKYDKESSFNETDSFKTENLEAYEESIEKVEIFDVEEVNVVEENLETNKLLEGDSISENKIELELKEDPIIEIDNGVENEVDTNEVIGGFEECRSVINRLYKTVFNSSFTPTLNDVVADLLAYIGAKAEEYYKEQEYLKAFGVETSRFADRYRQKSYLPLCFKISVWADKNKGLNETVELLNGLLRTLFAFNVSESEVKTVEKVSESIASIIEYLTTQGVETGF